MPVGLKDRQDQDQSLNPGDRHWNNEVAQRQSGASSALSSSEQAAFDGIVANYDNDANDQGNDANINNVRQAESEPSNSSSTLTNTPTKTEKDETRQQLSRKQKAMQFLNKKGPLGFILVLFFGGFGAMGALSSSALSVYEMRNALVQDLNDSLSALDTRNDHIVKHRLKGSRTRGFCTSHASFKCRYKSFSEKNAAKLKKAGFELENERKTVFGRVKFDSLNYIDDKGNKVRVPPENYNKAKYTGEFVSKMHKALNPKFVAFRDKIAAATYSKLKTGLGRLLNGSEDDMRNQIDEEVKKGIQEADGERLHKSDEVDENGKPIYKDSDGNKVELTDSQIDELEKNGQPKEIKGFEGKSHGIKGLLSSGFKAANMFTGTQAMICHTLSLIRLSSVAAKNLKYEQLARYAMIFLNTSDAVGTGGGIMEAVSMMMNILTHVDLRDKTINDEGDEKGSLGQMLSGEGLPSNADDIDIKPSTNPHKGQNALDSAGYNLAANGTVSKLDMRQSQFKLGGTAGGNKLHGLVNKMSSYPGFSVDMCDFYNNPITQIGGMILSVGLLIATGGLSSPFEFAKAGAQVIASIAINAYIEGMINDIVKGTIADSTTLGLDSGNALFSGTAAIMSSTASMHGLSPLSTKKSLGSSMRLAAETNAQYAEVARYEARDTPFDIYNQYSFLGSIAFKLYPSAAKSRSLASMALFAPVTFLSTALGFMSPHASAAVTSPPNRFDQCDDPTFKDINLNTADQMCNIRFGAQDGTINADPEKVVDWMVDSGQIDPTTGDTKTDADAVERVQAIPVSVQESATVLHDEDDPNPPAQVVSVQRGNPDGSPVKTAAQLDCQPGATYCQSLNGRTPGDAPDYPIEPSNAVRNTRTYAHWLRFCRYGAEGGRTVNFGDDDSDDGKNILTGLTSKAYRDDGRECMKSNLCKPGQNPSGLVKQNPNDGKWYVEETGDKTMKARCYPPQYDIYSIFSIDHTILDDSDEPIDDNPDDSQPAVSGDAKELAKKLTENPNISFVLDATKNDLIEFSKTGKATNYCGEPFAINALLSSTLLTMAKDYKILINNFGFQDDRNVACDQGQHPKGNAVDINGVEKISGGEKTNWGNISYDANDVKVVTDFSIGWMDTLAKTDPARGGVGQLGCGGFNIINQRKSNWQGPDGMLHFSDSCNHLHIDVRDRNDGSKI